MISFAHMGPWDFSCNCTDEFNRIPSLLRRHGLSLSKGFFRKNGYVYTETNIIVCPRCSKVSEV